MVGGIAGIESLFLVGSAGIEIFLAGSEQVEPLEQRYSEPGPSAKVGVSLRRPSERERVRMAEREGFLENTAMNIEQSVDVDLNSCWFNDLPDSPAVVSFCLFASIWRSSLSECRTKCRLRRPTRGKWVTMFFWDGRP
jgi:hypothetical protein